MPNPLSDRPNLAALELLHRYGVTVNGIPGGVPPLVYMMGWGTRSRSESRVG